MKIGIYTFYYAHNFGAVLQSYALKKVLSDMGNDVEFIPYRNTYIDRRYERKLKMSFSKKMIRYPGLIIKKITEGLKYKYMQEHWEQQYDKFELFIREILCVNENKAVDLNSYDMIITGSDQVWDIPLTGGVDDCYFLNFSYDGIRVAYGASNKKGYFSTDEIKIIKPFLKAFDYISTRESSLAECISKIDGIDAMCVVDPTLLLTADKYESIVHTYETEERYILVYLVVEDDSLLEYATEFAKRHNVKIIEIRYFYRKDLEGHNQVADAGPEEFLGLIKNADLIITNSFHGVVFSLMFKKEFYAWYDSNERINNLLEKLELEDRHITPNEQFDYQSTIINYSIVMDRLKEYQKESFKFLEMITKNS